MLLTSKQIQARDAAKTPYHTQDSPTIKSYPLQMSTVLTLGKPALEGHSCPLPTCRWARDLKGARPLPGTVLLAKLRPIARELLEDPYSISSTTLCDLVLPKKQTGHTSFVRNTAQWGEDVLTHSTACHGLQPHSHRKL